MCRVYNKKLGTVHWFAGTCGNSAENCADLVADLSDLDSEAKLEQEILNLQLQLAECEDREGASEISGDHKEQKALHPHPSSGMDPALA